MFGLCFSAQSLQLIAGTLPYFFYVNLLSDATIRCLTSVTEIWIQALFLRSSSTCATHDFLFQNLRPYSVPTQAICLPGFLWVWISCAFILVCCARHIALELGHGGQNPLKMIRR